MSKTIDEMLDDCKTPTTAMSKTLVGTKWVYEMARTTKVDKGKFKQAIREAIERAESENDRWIASGAYTTQADATAGLKTLIFRELGLDDSVE